MQGTVLGGRYELVTPLGKGGAAEVWRAHDRELDVIRAVKILTAAAAARKTMRRRLQAEAKALAQLHHPHVLRVLDIGMDHERPFLVMDLIEGGSVSDQVRLDGPLPPDRAITISLEVLSALAAAHGAGIVHRDIKPQNILLDGAGRAVVADFGIALVEAGERKTRTGVAMGSFAFMPPEQRVDAKRVGPPADLYAVGCSLFWMVTGRTPVDLFTDSEDAPRWERVSDPLRPILRWATRAEPEDRPQTAAELATALRALAPEAVATREILDPGRFPPPRVTLSPSLVGTPTPMGPHGAITTDVRSGVDTTDVLPTEVVPGPALVPAPRAPSAPRSRGGWLLVLAALLVLLVVLGLLTWRLTRSPDPAPQAPPPLTEALQREPETAPPAPGLPEAVSEAGTESEAGTVSEAASKPAGPTPGAVLAPLESTPLTLPRTWTGSFDGHPMDLTLAGPPGSLTGTVRVRLRGNAVDTPVRGRWDADRSELVLVDDLQADDAGSYRASLRDGRLHGTFTARYRGDMSRVLPFTLQPVQP